ncbi:capsule assembly Wzi family protein [Petrachloros mirabilis]
MNRWSIKRWRTGLLSFLFWVTSILVSPVEASVNLPLHHWAYDAIERLTVLGIIDQGLLTPKPYSRKEAARLISRAIERIRTDKVGEDERAAVAEPLLNRLMVEFRAELISVGTLKQRASESSGLFRYGARVQSELDGFSVGDGQSVRYRENRGGEYYANAVQNQTDVRGWFEVGDWATLMVQPKFISNLNALSQGPVVGPFTSLNDQYVYLREASLKLTFWNVALEIGRGTQWWGPGYHSSLLLTDNAFPLDMIKLGSDEAFRLPWKLRELGEWKVNSFLARLEDNRDFSHANIFGLRLSYLPASWLEVGLTRLTQFGGEGSGESFPRTVVDCYKNPPNQGAAQNCNEQAMVDFRAQVPHIPYLIPFPGGMQIYGELGSEDKWSQYPIPSRAAYLAGLYIPQVFSGDTMDIRIEYADTDYTRRKTGLNGVWYNNGTFTSGMRQYGFPLGASMGTDAIDLFIRTTRYVTDNLQIGHSLDYTERNRGGPVTERKQEVSADLTWWVTPRTQVTLGYTYQHIKNPGQISSDTPFVDTFVLGTARNHLVWLSLSKSF